ncbi:MAG: T9SS type A sorting domain-containing protein [Bacteroidales bacterium]|nr:T9SS type A sorting domain-containing protein [Bacteroidales bacterium]
MNNYYPNPIRRLFVLSAIIMLFSSNSYSQEGIWADPVAVSDSLTNNTNANIIFFKGDDYMFWEKSTDESSTAIYMRNLSDMGDPMAVLEDEGVHYKNPQFIKFSGYPNPPDTLFYLFYEREIEGIFGLHYIKYSQDGNFTEQTEPFFYNVNEIKNLSIYYRLLVWETESLVFSKELVYENNIYSLVNLNNVDNDSSNPSPGDNAIAYETEINGHSHIYKGTLTPYDYWYTEELFTEGENTSVSLVAENMYGNAAIIWESYQDEQWEIYGYGFWEEEIESLNIVSPSKLSPHAIYFDVVIKDQNDDINLTYLTYVFDENGNDDIFVTESYGWDQYVNISNSSANDSHPKLFYSPINFSYTSYLLWESNKNGHQQLFMSKIWFIVDTEEVAKNNFSLKLSPNPLRHNLSISYCLQSQAQVELSIYTETGKLIKSLISKTQESGPHHYSWNAKDELGKRVSSGVYFIKLQIDGQVITKKIILQ